MIFKLYESTKKSSVRKINDTVEIYLNKFSDAFTEEGIRKIVVDTIKTNTCIFSLSSNSILLNDIYDAVIYDYSYDKIIEILTKNNVIFFSLFIHGINYGKKAYKLMKDINSCKEIYFNCNKDNLLDVLYLCEKIDIPVIIVGTSISLEEYQKILDGYDLNRITNNSVFVHYQEYGGDIDINTLYDTSCQINYITKKIKKYNLSPLERVLLVYDIVKNNSYHKEGNNENYLISRTLDNVLNSDYIVCAGYIAIINAMLKNLNINAIPIICKTKKEKHCRSIIYLVDKKYNIDGIYALDPTWDSKRNDTENIIDKYNYFLMPLEIAEKTATTELMPIINMSISDLVALDSELADSKYITEEKALDRIRRQYYLKMIFSLTGNNDYDAFAESICFYEFLNDNDKEKITLLYNDILKRCKASDINIDVFIRALYNTKKIEYYLSEDKLPEEYSSRLDLPSTDSINILDIKNSALARYCKIKALDNTKGDLYSFICYLQYEEHLNRYISSNVGRMVSPDTDNGIKRDMLNMKLLKTLKREKVKKEIDNR